MSEVVDVESNLRVSNQDESSLLDDAENSGSKLDVKPENWLGAWVNKQFGNKASMGKVASYCGETRLFKINYENGVSEKVDYQGLQQIVAPPELVNDHHQITYPRWYWYNKTEKKGKKRHQPEGQRVPIHPRRYSSATLPQQVEPKKRKCKKEAGTSGAASRPAYIPLAFRETKRDAYVYYK